MDKYNNHSLLPYHTFGMDVKTSVFIEYTSVDELKQILQQENLSDKKWLHIGGGSNLLFTGDYVGVILHSAIKGTEIVYEDDEAVGSYNSNIILSRMSHPESFITINVDPIIKFINQTSILNQSDLDKIFDFVVADNKLTLSNRIGSYSTEANTAADFSIKFDLDLFKGVISNFDSDEIHLAPMFGPGTDDNGNNIQIPVGCIFWTEDITTILAGGKVGV